MKKALIIAYEFPPLGGPGVLRTLNYVKYLKGFGWEPSVITVKDLKRERSTRGVPRDESLLRDIPIGTKIERAPHLLFPWGIRVILHRLPDDFIGWVLFAYAKALDMIRKDNYDLVYTTSPPEANHLVGYLLKKTTNKPWVMDFRDPWTQNKTYHYGFINGKINKSLEKRCLENADAVISVVPRITEDLKTLIDCKKDKFYTIPNGYDEADFVNYKPKNQYGGKFIVSYTGGFHGGYPKGYSYPFYFFEGILQLLKNEEISHEDLKIVLVGESGEKKIHPGIPETMISRIGQISHEKVFDYISNASVLLFCINKEIKYAMSGKIFEYIRANKPILALVLSDSPPANLIKETDTGIAIEPDDVEGIKKAILYFYNQWKNKNLKINPDWEIIRRYDRKNLTKKLAQIFDESINERKK